MLRYVWHKHFDQIAGDNEAEKFQLANHVYNDRTDRKYWIIKHPIHKICKVLWSEYTLTAAPKKWNVVDVWIQKSPFLVYYIDSSVQIGCGFGERLKVENGKLWLERQED